jgi:hypothetical protein
MVEDIGEAYRAYAKEYYDMQKEHKSCPGLICREVNPIYPNPNPHLLSSGLISREVNIEEVNKKKLEFEQKLSETRKMLKDEFVMFIPASGLTFSVLDVFFVSDMDIMEAVSPEVLR